VAEPIRLGLPQLRAIVSDGGELAKGAACFQSGGLAHLARFEDRLYADAAGSGASPYKVSVTLSKLERGRCTCMAARSRPFCKHAAALLVAWASQPEAFAVSDAPAQPDAPARAAAVKRGKVDGEALLAKGVEQALELAADLGTVGLGARAGDRAAHVAALAEPLRANRLRRLSARVRELAAMLEKAGDGEEVDPVAWTDRVSDLLLAARRVQRHLAGETLEDRYVEELIGKSWTKKDRVPVEGLDLVEVAWTSTVTADDFRIVESRFVDLRSGESWCEKQILPTAIARRTEPKRSWGGLVLRGARGSRFPGFAPARLDLDDPGEVGGTSPADLERLRSVALPRVGEALGRLQERRRDLFAPDLLPVVVAADTVLAGRARLQLVDEQGAAVFLPDDPGLARRLAESLRDVRLRAVVGDLGLDGALPTLWPLAVVVDGPEGLALRPLSGVDPAALRGRRRAATGARTRWVDVARAAGLSPAAVALGEVREELAQAVANGVAGFTPRTAAPVAQRLRDLGLEKPGAVVAAAAELADPRGRLDELVKVHQVTGIALVRLAGAVPVDRAALVSVPTFESVRVPAVSESPPPDEVARRLGAGALDRWRAAVLLDAWYRAVPAEELAAQVYPVWADSSASPFVARAFAARPAEGLAAARRVLAEPLATSSRVARLTALRVLDAVGSAEALGLLDAQARGEDVGLAAWAARLRARHPAATGLVAGLRAVAARLVPARAAPDPGLRGALLMAPRAEDRVLAAREIAARGDLEGLPALRAAHAGDPTDRVRNAAAEALAALLDLESAEVFLELLGGRATDDAAAKSAAWALGATGDWRAQSPLLQAYEEGWHPLVCIEAVKNLGGPSLAALVGWLEVRPELAARQGAKSMVAAGGEAAAAEVLRRLEGMLDAPDLVPRARVLFGLVKDVAGAQARFARVLLPRRPDLAQGDADARALARACARALPEPAKKA